MDDYTIIATPEILSSTADAVSQKTNVVKNTFSEINSRVKQMAAYWIGDASDLNRRMFDEQIPAMEEIIKRFGSQAENLREIAANYMGTQKIIIEEITGLPDDAIE